MILDDNISNKSEAEAEVYYDLYDPFLYELKGELEQIFAQSFVVKSKRISYGASPIMPIIEIILTFATVQIATSFLSKIGEDFYSILKSKLSKKLDKRQSKIILCLIINTDMVATQGSITFDNYQIIADAIKATEGMVMDAHGKHELGINPISDDTPIMWKGDKGVVYSQAKIQATYDYNQVSKRWELKKIRRFG